VTCPGLDRGHCSCGSECCVTSQGTCVCPDCLCTTVYDRERPEPILVPEPQWRPWPIG